MFFKTKNGAIGLGPASTQTGDTINIFPSGRTHFLLRESGQKFPFRQEDPFRQKVPLWRAGFRSDYHRISGFELIGDCYLNADEPTQTPGVYEQEAGDGEPNLEGALPYEMIPPSSRIEFGLGDIETIVLV